MGRTTLTGSAVYVPTVSYCDSPMTGGPTASTSPRTRDRVGERSDLAGRRRDLGLGRHCRRPRRRRALRRHRERLLGRLEHRRRVQRVGRLRRASRRARPLAERRRGEPSRRCHRRPGSRSPARRQGRRALRLAGARTSAPARSERCLQRVGRLVDAARHGDAASRPPPAEPTSGTCSVSSGTRSSVAKATTLLE